MQKVTVNQRDVFLLPTPVSTEDHLFIVLSSTECNEYENTFIGVMITSSDKYFDDFSFELTNDMFNNPLRKEGSHARMHLMTLCFNENIQPMHRPQKVNQMKPLYFNQLMKSIGELVFNFKFSPL